jgi:colanic acid biosynthesis glycosyl transferase WcaI
VGLVNRLGLDNVVMKEFVSRSRLSELQALSDVSVVTLRSGFGNTSVPSKVLGYMSAGRGVIALVDKDCDTAELIEVSRAGVVVSGDNVVDFAEKLIKLVGDRSVSKRWGDNARAYVVANLDAKVVLSRAADVLEGIG